MAATLEPALAEAGVRFRAETCPAAHGWMTPDFPAYDTDSARRGGCELEALFHRALSADAARLSN